MGWRVFYDCSEVGAYMRLFRGLLYKKYPGLWRMLCSSDQRRYLIQIADDKAKHDLMNISNVTIVKYTEIEEILAGKDKKYRAVPPKPLLKGDEQKFNVPTPKKVETPNTTSRSSRSKSSRVEAHENTSSKT